MMLWLLVIKFLKISKLPYIIYSLMKSDSLNIFYVNIAKKIAKLNLV